VHNCQRFAARTFNDVIDVFPARYRIGFSADEHRKDRKEFLIYDAFGSVAVDISREEVVKRKLVLDVEIRVVPTEFRADWYVEQQKEDRPDFNRLLEEMTKNKHRNLIATSIARTMMGLGHQVLMLTHRREHAASFIRAEIESGTRAGLLLGGPENTAEFASTVKAIRSGELKIAAGTYQAIGQGMDVPSVSRGVACTPIASNTQFFGQVRGRLCRKYAGKKDAVLYYLWDKDVFGIEPILNLRKWNKVVMVESGDEWLTAADFVSEWNKQRKK
jgi:superfamily II DNA or RNA helicase